MVSFTYMRIDQQTLDFVRGHVQSKEPTYVALRRVLGLPPLPPPYGTSRAGRPFGVRNKVKKQARPKRRGGS